MRTAAVVVTAGLVAAYALDRIASSRAAAAVDDEQGAGETAFDYANPWGYISRTVDMHQNQRAAESPNLPAFLSMIARAEGTDRASDPYRVCFGERHEILSYSDHPAVTGEWKGERLSAAHCKGAGYGAGCVSTAAGRYQLLKPTWLDCKRTLALFDFSPANQDAAAVLLIRRAGALPAIEAGRIEEAIEACRRIWASLPGAGYGQPERKLAALVDAYTDAGGWLA